MPEAKQFTSWLFAQRIRDVGLTPSMGSIGDCFDNSMIESFRSRMQVELLDRQRWNTRVALAPCPAPLQRLDHAATNRSPRWPLAERPF